MVLRNLTNESINQNISLVQTHPSDIVTWQVIDWYRSTKFNHQNVRKIRNNLLENTFTRAQAKDRVGCFFLRKNQFTPVSELVPRQCEARNCGEYFCKILGELHYITWAKRFTSGWDPEIHGKPTLNKAL